MANTLVRSRASTQRAKIASIVIAAVMLAVVGGGTVISIGTTELLQTVADEWHGQRKISENKGQMLASIRRHMGYGGMIHHFKNFVLRKDPALLRNIRRNLDELHATFDNLERSELNAGEREALAKLRHIVGRYEKNLSIAVTASEGNWSAEMTDAQVRIDDTPAYEALKVLHETWFNKFNEDTQRFETVISEGIRGLRITTMFIPLLVLAGLVILWFTRRLTREIAERKVAEHKLLLAETVFDSISEAAMVTDADNKILAVNPAFTAISGYAPEEVIGKNPNMLSSGRHDREFYERMWQVIETEGAWEGEIWNRRRSGEIFPERLSIVKAPSSNGELGEYIAIFADITEQKAREDQILHLAHHDRLTGLPNRSLFNDRLEVAIRTAERAHHAVVVMFIDLDGFKAVNDTLGHAAGDDLLCQVTARFKTCLRNADTLARLGGDEFAVVLPSIEDMLGAERVARKLLQSLQAEFSISDNTAQVGASIGMASFPEHGDTAQHIVHQADLAMYEVKKSGKNDYRFADDTTEKVLLEA